MSPRIDNQHGFTLIELMIYTAIFGLVLGAVLGTYRAQLRTQTIQREKIEMQQNLRAALYLMDREIKMAGLNPARAAGIGIKSAHAHELRFTMDFTGGATAEEWFDGVATFAHGEDVTYTLSNDDDTNGRNDGLPTEGNDGSTCHLLRNGEVMALNIDALNFAYLDENGDFLTAPGTDEALIAQIRAIQVTLVARSGESVSIQSQLDIRIYENQNGDVILPAQNDAFRRLALSSEIRCRNLGLGM